MLRPAALAAALNADLQTVAATSLLANLALLAVLLEFHVHPKLCRALSAGIVGLMPPTACPSPCLLLVLALVFPSFPSSDDAVSPEPNSWRRGPRSTPRRRQWRPADRTPTHTIASDLSIMRLSTPPPQMNVDEGIPLDETRRRVALEAD
eukprot:565121-Karenia_brevis.AAC.1